MNALVFDGTGVTLETRRPDPVPGQGEAVVAVRRVVVDGLDLDAARGARGFRGVLGHAFVGDVESVDGEDRRGLRGQRVVGAIEVICGRCDLCRGGIRAHCRERTVLGLEGRDGCLAERFTVPAANLVVVPEGVDDDHAAFAHPVACARQVVRQLTFEGKPYITVLGDGRLGLLIAQVAARLNASVRVVGKHPGKLALCERWRIRHRHVDDIGRRADQDIVVDATGAEDGVALAAQLVRPRGTIVCKSTSTACELAPIVRNELTIVGSGAGSMTEAVASIAAGEVDVVSLISRRMRLADGPAILDAARRPEMLAVLVAPD
jgi:threonine dehydrogenase-like Zn-dependent dehydrogenase